MIEIYFDGQLLDNQNYLAFSASFKPFDKEFYLGSTGCVSASLTIPKGALPANLNNVVIKIDNEDWYHCVVDAIEENDNEEYVISLIEKLVDTEVGYDFSDKVPISAKTLLENICTDFNIPYDEFSFDNQDVEISSHDNTITAREYIGMIAELAGGYAKITNEGKLEIRTYLDDISQNTITADDVDTFKIKNTITIERVVWEFVSEKKESSEDSSLYTLYLDGNNLFLQNMSEEIFNNICNNVIGLSLSNIKISTTNKFFNTKSIIKFVDRENTTHNILPMFEIDYNGGFVGSYDSEIQNTKRNETNSRNTTERVKRIKQTVDQDNNLLQIAIEDISYQKEVTNKEIRESIKSNTSLIESTASTIRLEVEATEGRLQDNLDHVEENLQGQITTNKSDIVILKDNITSTVKSIGGNNLLRNSVGFAKTLNNGIYELDFWNITNPQNVQSIQDTETESSTVSGSKFVITGNATLEQEYVTQLNTIYGVSLKLKHIPMGNLTPIKIQVLDGENRLLNVLTEEQETREYRAFMQLSEFTYEAKSVNPKIIIEYEGDDIIEISDLIISSGENQAWSSYFDEVYGKEHRLDKYGLRLIDLGTNDYSSQTSKGLTFIDDGEVVSEISRVQVKSDTGRFNNEMTLRKLQWIVLDDNNIIEYIE